MKPVRVRKVRAGVRDEHELLQQDDFNWLAELKEAVSPYWVARLVYQPDRVSVLAIQGRQDQKPAGSGASRGEK